MVSPELLRRYPFFAGLNDAQLREIAMITAEETHPGGEVLLREDEPANALYLLLDGGVDLFYRVEEEYRPELTKEFSIGEVDAGEPFSISALIEPYTHSASARTLSASRVLRVDGVALRELCRGDVNLGFALMNKIARAALERLNDTRVMLAAAWAEQKSGS